MWILFNIFDITLFWGITVALSYWIAIKAKAFYNYVIRLPESEENISKRKFVQPVPLNWIAIKR